MAKKKVDVTPKEPALDFPRESIVLGHLIKYNLYLLSKSIVFAALVNKGVDPLEAANDTNKIIAELDLDTKRKTEQQN